MNYNNFKCSSGINRNGEINNHLSLRLKQFSTTGTFSSLSSCRVYAYWNCYTLVSHLFMLYYHLITKFDQCIVVNVFPRYSRMKHMNWKHPSSTSCRVHYYIVWRMMTFLTLFLMGFLTNRKLWGGRSAPPSYMAIWGYFQYSFLTGVFSWI